MVTKIKNVEVNSTDHRVTLQQYTTSLPYSWDMGWLVVLWQAKIIFYWPFPASYVIIVFSIKLAENKILTGFKLQIFVVKRDHSSNWATTSASQKTWITKIITESAKKILKRKVVSKSSKDFFGSWKSCQTIFVLASHDTFCHILTFVNFNKVVNL